MLPILDEFAIIPEHQFGFRRGHGTPEQCHRIINEILSAFESKKYCTATFLDVQEASQLLQAELRLIRSWFLFWKIKGNSLKSAQITFALRRGVI